MIKTLLDWVRPPPFWQKKSKKISVFSVKEILDSTRPSPFGKTSKKMIFFLLLPLGQEQDLTQRNTQNGGWSLWLTWNETSSVYNSFQFQDHATPLLWRNLLVAQLFLELRIYSSWNVMFLIKFSLGLLVKMEVFISGAWGSTSLGRKSSSQV